MLKGQPIERILVDVSAHSLGILALGSHDQEDDEGRYLADTFVPIIRRNTVLPATRSEDLYTAIDEQEPDREPERRTTPRKLQQIELDLGPRGVALGEGDR